LYIKGPSDLSESRELIRVDDDPNRLVDIYAFNPLLDEETYSVCFMINFFNSLIFRNAQLITRWN